MHKKPEVLVGMILGVAMALITCVVAVTLYVLRGPAAFERLGVSLTEVVAIYCLAGVLGGAIGGLLYPLTRWRGGAALLGAFAATPLYVGAALLLSADWSTGVIAAWIVGGAVGHNLMAGGSRLS